MTSPVVRKVDASPDIWAVGMPHEFCVRARQEDHLVEVGVYGLVAAAGYENDTVRRVP